jgi:hypothetical protein
MLSALTQKDGGLILQQTVQSVYAEDNDDTPTTVGVQRTQLTGLGSCSIQKFIRHKKQRDQGLREKIREKSHPFSEGVQGWGRQKGVFRGFTSAFFGGGRREGVFSTLRFCMNRGFEQSADSGRKNYRLLRQVAVHGCLSECHRPARPDDPEKML